MEPCPTGSCAMGIAKEATEAGAGEVRLALSPEPPFSNLLWGGQEEVALDVPILAGISLSETETALVPPVGCCLPEEWPEARSPARSSRKGGLVAAAEELFPEPLSRRAGETPLPKDPGELFTYADPDIANPPNTAALSRRKRSRGRKPWKKTALGQGSGPVLPWDKAEGPVGPGRVPKKRGRKSKAELLLLKLSQECQAAESSSQQKAGLAASEEDSQCLETTPGGRPKRRAVVIRGMRPQASLGSRWMEGRGELFTYADPDIANPPNTAALSRRKRSRGRKPWKKTALGQGSGPVLPWDKAEGPGPSENGPVGPGRVPKKRGRKSKAELLLLKLSQECQAAESSSQQKAGLAASEEDSQCLETTPGGRPKRRAAKVALLYLQELAEELTSAYQAPPCADVPEGVTQPREPGRKRRGRKPKEQRWEAEEDADFVPSEEGLLHAEAEEEEEEEEAAAEEQEEESSLLLSEASEPELEPALPGAARPRSQCRGFAPNGLHKSVMAPVWMSLSVTHRLREQLHSPWEFPEWIPSARRWAFLSENEAVDYLPGEVKSPLFSIRREGLQEDRGILYRINRFNALQPHEERLDMTFFVGGPVWALEWCPTPEGSGASQYVALSCNPGMDDRHTLAGTHSGPALLQLWEVGPLQQDMGSVTKPALAYGIATDHGCIWDMKFCPSGAWEPPTTCRKSPHMSRLGLLAVAFSDGQVLIYALPHAEAMRTHWRAQVPGVGAAPRHAICKVSHVASLQVGSVQAGNAVDCGQCFSVAWMPSKPHHHLAAGFYDGTVALWNLSTKSLLQRVRQPDGSLKLYPFRCFLAHDHAVRHIQWCKANSHFLVTAGNDRKVKFWDVRRLHEPLNSIKRFLSTETAWLLPYSGVTVAQDNCYASYGLCGIHYLDAGYLGFRAYFVAPRKGTVWSISGSDWLNTVAAGDVTGELVAAVMPDLSVNPHNIKRPSERRFPVYKADLLSCSLLSKEAATTRPPERTPVGGRTYSESVAQNYLLFRDPDLRSFKNVFRQKPRSPHHPLPEAKEGDGLGRLQLEAVHKVRFSPNLDCHSWLVSGGQSGLVRLHCLRALASPLSHKLLRECQAQFGATFDRGGEGDSEASPCSPPEVPTAVS